MSITCLVWPKDRPNEIVFGLADGKVKLGDLIKNKPYTMYTHPDGSYVVSLAASPNGLSVVSGHLDGAMFKYTFPTEDGGAGMRVGRLMLVWLDCVVGPVLGVEGMGKQGRCACALSIVSSLCAETRTQGCVWSLSCAFDQTPK